MSSAIPLILFDYGELGGRRIIMAYISPRALKYHSFATEGSMDGFSTASQADMKSVQSDHGGTESHAHMCICLLFSWLSAGTEPCNTLPLPSCISRAQLQARRSLQFSPSKAGTHSQTLSPPVKFKCLVKLMFVYLITSRGKYGDRKEEAPLN